MNATANEKAWILVSLWLLTGAKARHAVYVYIDRHEIFLLQGSSQGADSGEKNKAVDEELTRAVLI